MENTTATGQTTRRPKTAVVGNHLIRFKKIAFARNGNNADIANGEPVEQGCWVQFKRHWIFIPGLTVEGLQALIEGDPF
jgi:hypothetical protein